MAEPFGLGRRVGRRFVAGQETRHRGGFGHCPRTEVAAGQIGQFRNRRRIDDQTLRVRQCVRRGTIGRHTIVPLGGSKHLLTGGDHRGAVDRAGIERPAENLFSQLGGLTPGHRPKMVDRLGQGVRQTCQVGGRLLRVERFPLTEHLVEFATGAVGRVRSGRTQRPDE